MRGVRFRFVILVLSGGETGVAGAEGVAACKSSDTGRCAPAPADCEGGGVLGATVVTALCRGGGMSAKRELNSWPSIGLRLSIDLVASCQWCRDRVNVIRWCYAPQIRVTRARGFGSNMRKEWTYSRSCIELMPTVCM